MTYTYRQLSPYRMAHVIVILRIEKNPTKNLNKRSYLLLIDLFFKSLIRK